MADKIDPFDVAALERSLNDSATRVSTIWVSFLIFALYLVIAVATVDHRQLLLAEPVKLPILSIELSLWGFFFLAPILFVIFHGYAVLQVLLLGRTAAAYNDAIRRAGLVPSEDASVRQRLANTLFAQIFAGSPRERAGWLGWLLRAMAWITLAIAPILVLLMFQFRFLPYHSHLITWTHRLLILAELAAVFLLWPLVLNARRDFEWPRIRRRFKRTAAVPFELFGPKQRRQLAWRRLLLLVGPLIAWLAILLISFWWLAFPGEPHVNLLTGHAWSSVQCDRGHAPFDRLLLPEEVVPPPVGRPTRDFRSRDFNCAYMPLADLRGAELSRARMFRANLDRAELRGARLQGTTLDRASLREAKLQGASLEYARLEGTSLDNARLQGASLYGAHLSGASLNAAQLQGAALNGAWLAGAALNDAQLQGASLEMTRLSGASLNGAQLQGASLYAAMAEGVDFTSADLTLARIWGAVLWRASGAKCDVAHVIQPHLEPASLSRTWIPYILEDWELIVEPSEREGEVAWEPIAPTPEWINWTIDQATAHAQEDRKESLRTALRSRLSAESPNDTAAIAKVWSDCAAAAASVPQPKIDRRHAALLRSLACDAADGRKVIAKGVIRNWIWDHLDRREFSAQLARGLLGEDGKDCAATKDLDESDRELLRKFARASVPVPKDRLPAKQ